MGPLSPVFNRCLCKNSSACLLKENIFSILFCIKLWEPRNCHSTEYTQAPSILLDDWNWHFFQGEVQRHSLCALKVPEVRHEELSLQLRSYLKAILPVFHFMRKSLRVIIGRFYFSLSVISVFKNTYFVDNTASKYMPISSSGDHLLENQKGNWLYFDFQWSILSRTFQELFCVYVIFFFTYSLSLESNSPSLAWDFAIVHFLMEFDQ